MGKKKEPPAKARPAPKKPNPFELKKKANKKFDVTGKRQGKAAGQKNVIQARQDAVDKRKKTLLVEYKQLRKANTFIDRRFGESDPNMSEDAKAMARLQEQHVQDEARKRKKRGGQKFVLGEHDQADDDGSALGGLTHLGKNIADMDDFNDAPPDLDDLDEDMVQDLVSTYNFGGGGETADGEGGAEHSHKTRKQVMEEIIAKSKMYKAIKAKQREEDEDELEKLNAEFQGLVKHHALKSLLKPPGFNKGLKVPADAEADAAYDVATRALAAEARGAAGDRVLGPEEQAERERVRMEMLEKERLRRMRGTGGDDDVEMGPSSLGVAEGGYAARRHKLREKEQQQGSSSGDEDGDGSGSEGAGDEDSSEEEEEGGAAGRSKLEQRRMEQAAGDHPLQSTFRLQAAQLLQKYGVDSKNPLVADQEEDESEDGEEESGEESGDEDGSKEDNGSDLQGMSGSEISDAGSDEAESEDGEDNQEGATERKRKLALLQQKLEEGLRERELKKQQQQQQDSGKQAKEGNKQQQPQQQQLGSKEEQQQQRAVVNGTLELHGPQDLPYTIKMPESYPKFAALVRGRSAEDLAIIISRIRGFNATALASDSKRGLQVLYGMLIQHFAMLAGETPLPLAHLDAMVPLLLPMTAEVPFYAATVARARLKHMHERLSAALNPAPPTASSAASTRSSPWPTPRTLLQLKLLTTLFPVSDRRHPVVTPASLLVGKYLSQCVAGSVAQVACGLLLVGIALHMASSARRFAPEPLIFLTDALWSALEPRVAQPPSRAGAKQSSSGSGAASKARASSAAVAAMGTAKRAWVGREGGQSVPRVAPGMLAPSASGASLAVLQPESTELLPWLERIGSSATASSSGGSGSSSDGSGRRGSEQARRGGAKGEESEQGDEVKLGMLATVLKLLSRSAGLLQGCEAAPEALAPALRALQALGKALRLPPALEQHRQAVESELAATTQHVLTSRTPLVQASRIRAPVVREYNPRFEDGFSLGRDYDPDRERAEQRKLKRMVQKERRGALRELRKDASFMADVRDKERAKVDAERMCNEKRFYSELQSFEANMRSGGQGGMNPHLKKKKK